MERRAWVRVAFDGEGLVMAQITRRHPGVVVHTRVGQPVEGVYPTAARVSGLPAWRALAVRLALQARYRRAVHVTRRGPKLVAQVGMHADQLHSETLRQLLLLEHAFEPPLLRFAGGRVEVFLRPRPGTNAQRILARLAGIDGRVLESFDPSPWDGLEPASPQGKAWLGLRPPPPPGS